MGRSGKRGAGDEPARFFCVFGILPAGSDKKYRVKRISLFTRMQAGQEECLEFDLAVFTAFVEKVVVSGTKKEVRLVYVLRDGSVYRVDGVR